MTPSRRPARAPARISARTSARPAGRIGRWTALAAALVLSGCASDQGDYLQLGLLRQSLAGTFGGQSADITPTRALVDEAGVPLILAEVAEHDVRATIYPVGENGPVTTWMAADKTTLALRNGQLVGSRGLAPDLMSAAVPTLADLRRGTAVARSHFYLGRDDQTVRRDFTCTGQIDGRETLEIIGLRFETEVISETCEGPTARFVNRYWVQADGTVRQSRQWVGPAVGFLKLQRLDR